MRITRLLCRLAPCTIALGCASEPGSPAERGDAPGPTPAPATLGAGPAAADEPAALAGPCAGKSAGAHGCDGQRLVRCEGDASVALRTCLGIERCDAERGACAPACGEGEVYVPPTGPEGFVMGGGYTVGPRTGHIGKGHQANSDRPHRVVLTRPFCIDATEVTVADVARCVAEKGCEEPNPQRRFVTYPDKRDHPVNAYHWRAARYFCEQHGKSLPTEAQWEWAATGDDERKWPWGNEAPTCELADFTAENLISPGGDSGCHGGGPSPVGSHPAGDRVWPSGKISDLAGNVWEWVLDSYVPYQGSDEVDPVHFDKKAGNYVVRGGGWNRSARGILAAFRGGAVTTYQVPGLGFRCVRNPRPQ